jgi:hypothetical protein
VTEFFHPCDAIDGGCWDRSTCGGYETEFDPDDGDIWAAYSSWHDEIKPVSQDFRYFDEHWRDLPDLRRFVEIAVAKRIVE